MEYNYNGKFTISINEIIKQGGEIFDFSFPFYDKDSLEDFKSLFIKHFKYYEIGQDTVEEFKDCLQETLLINYPKYLHYFNTQKVAKTLRWQYNKDYDVEHTRELKSVGVMDIHSESQSSNTGKYDNKSSDKTNSTNKFLDTPQGRTETIDDGYLTNITKDEIKNDITNSGTNSGGTTSESATSNERTGQDTETTISKEYGNIGTTSSGELVQSWLKDGLFNIPKMIIKDCEELFMLIY